MISKIFFIGVCAFAITSISCQSENNNSSKNEAKSMDSILPQGTFGYDLAFLSKRDEIILLKNDDSSGQIIVSPKYQGKVFTSTASGKEGKSFGWVNYKAFDEPVNDHMNAYGGEDRLWLGPEGGKFSLFFKQGSNMNFENWHTPKAFDSESWKLTKSDKKGASLVKDFDLVSFAGTPLKIQLQRDITILENDEIQKLLNIEISNKVQSVGFKTENHLINNGTNEWTEQTGAPCIWNLDMFVPSPSCVILIPYHEGMEGKIATTDYFGEISKDRIKYEKGILFFKADGKSRGKLGIPPVRAKEIAGSFDATDNILTITMFDIHNDKKYLNQEWRTDRDPYSGDAVNAYNDGPLEDGTQMGPFYEIESVSPPAFLKKDERVTHNHAVFHFTGDQESINKIAQKVFGVTLQEIQNKFK